MDTYTGGCHCGAVTIRLEGPPDRSTYCHCVNCRKTTGAAFVMVGTWPTHKVHLELTAPLLEVATSPYLTRKSCPQCGASILNAIRTDTAASDNVFLPLLDELDDGARPDRHIFYSQRVMDVEDGLQKRARFK